MEEIIYTPERKFQLSQKIIKYLQHRQFFNFNAKSGEYFITRVAVLPQHLHHNDPFIVLSIDIFFPSIFKIINKDKIARNVIVPNNDVKREIRFKLEKYFGLKATDVGIELTFL